MQSSSGCAGSGTRTGSWAHQHVALSPHWNAAPQREHVRLRGATGAGVEATMDTLLAAPLGKGSRGAALNPGHTERLAIT